MSFTAVFFYRNQTVSRQTAGSRRLICATARLEFPHSCVAEPFSGWPKDMERRLAHVPCHGEVGKRIELSIDHSDLCARLRRLCCRTIAFTYARGAPEALP